MYDLNNEIDNCLLCLELIEYNQKIVNPKYCKCKIKLHINCLTQIENSGLLCPICRKKPNNQDDNIIVYPYSIYDNEPYILWFPYFIFYRNSNFLTLSLVIIWSFFVTIFYVIPLLIYYGLVNDKYKKYVIGSLSFIIGIIYYI